MAAGGDRKVRMAAASWPIWKEETGKKRSSCSEPDRAWSGQVGR